MSVGELPSELSKHVSPDCYMCGIVRPILVSSSVCLSSWVLCCTLVQVAGGGANQIEYARAFHVAKAIAAVHAFVGREVGEAEGFRVR